MKNIFTNIAESPVDNTVCGNEIPFLFKKEILHLPKSLLVGKKVTYPMAKQGMKEEDGGNPPLSRLWGQCKKDGTFEYLERQKNSVSLEGHVGLYCDINKNNDGNFSYIVGVLMKAGTAVPEGFASRDVPESDVAVCWYRYKDGEDIWSVAHGTVVKYMEEQGYIGLPEAGWCSEFYPFGDEEYKARTGYNLLGYLIAGTKKETNP